MAALSEALQHQREAEFDRNEAKLASAWQGKLPASTDVRGEMISPFIQYCDEHRVRWVPATPYVVAAYVEWLKTLGIGNIPGMLRAIEELHDQRGYSNPVDTLPVRLALLNHLATKEAPRSWTKEEKIAWAMLPFEVGQAIARRDKDRETQLRRLQNELAQAKRLNDSAVISKPVELNEKEVSTNG